MSIAAAHEENLSRRVSEEGGEKVYRSEKAAESASVVVGGAGKEPKQFRVII
jgi:hypothetical protein